MMAHFLFPACMNTRAQLMRCWDVIISTVSHCLSFLCLFSRWALSYFSVFSFLIPFDSFLSFVCLLLASDGAKRPRREPLLSENRIKWFFPADHLISVIQRIIPADSLVLTQWVSRESIHTEQWKTSVPLVAVRNAWLELAIWLQQSWMLLADLKRNAGM